MLLSYSGGFAETVAELAEHERAGLDLVWVRGLQLRRGEPAGLPRRAHRRVEIAAGILQIYTRTPTLTAMTAAGLDCVSGGRFLLGLGASGPQVVEGFHGVALRRAAGPHPRGVEICRRSGAASASSTRAATTASRSPPTGAPAWASRCS